MNRNVMSVMVEKDLHSVLKALSTYRGIPLYEILRESIIMYIVRQRSAALACGVDVDALIKLTGEAIPLYANVGDKEFHMSLLPSERPNGPMDDAAEAAAVAERERREVEVVEAIQQKLADYRKLARREPDDEWVEQLVKRVRVAAGLDA